MLKKDEISFPHQTLSYWKHRYADRYQAIREDVLPAVRAKAADEHMDLAERLMQANRQVIDRTIENTHLLEPRDLPGAARNLSVAAAVETEKAEMLNDRPTQRVSHNLSGVLKDLKNLGVEVVEGTATEEEIPQLSA